tara:strand:- start:704 stop:1702 length:999 start_codon:yes stop_codon:yes gene_type:complete
MSDENHIAESKIITINSSNAERLNGTNLSNIVFNFNDVVKSTTETTNTISLQSVEMPFSIYNVDYNRNKIAIRITLADGSTTDYTLTLTEGNYNANTFRNEVKGKFLSATATYNINMEISTTTGVFNLTPTTNDLTNVIFLLDGTTCNKIIGLSQDTTFPFNLTNPTSFNFPANFLGVKKLSLYSDAFAGNNIDSQSLGENTLINTISVNAPAWGLITYQNASLNESILRNNFINRIDLQIRDEEGYLVDFNNTDYEMTFILRTYTEYKERLKVGNFSDLVRNERRDNAVREILENPEYEDAPILEKIKLLAQEEKTDLSEFQDTELDILLE